MSVKKAINDILPQEWDYVLRKNKVLTRVIDLIYEIVYLKAGVTIECISVLLNA